jgi:hypothetical protein
MATTTKTEAATMSARAAARLLGTTHPTVLQMLEAGKLPGKLRDGQWQIPAAAVQTLADATLNRSAALGADLDPSAGAAAWLDREWTGAMVDALAAEIHSARELVSTYELLQAQHQQGAAWVVERERLLNLDAVLARHALTVTVVEKLREARVFVDTCRARAQGVERELAETLPVAHKILNARREDHTARFGPTHNAPAPGDQKE